MAKEGILSGIAEWKIAGIPVGAVGAGAVTAGVGDAIVGAVQGVAPQVPSWALKGVMAWATIQWMGRFIGDTGAQVGGLFLAYDAVQELFNIRQSISNILGGLLGKVQAFSPPAFTGPRTPAQSSAPDGAGYYPSIMGRSG